MRWVRLTLLGLLVALITVRYPPALTARGLSPVWLFLPGLLAGLRSAPGRAAAIGWGFGLVADILSMEPLGAQAFVYGAAAYGLARVRGVIFSDHPTTQAVSAALLTVIASFALLLRIEAASESFAFVARVPPALVGAAFTGIVFPFVVWADGKAGILAGFRERDGGVQA